MAGTPGEGRGARRGDGSSAGGGSNGDADHTHQQLKQVEQIEYLLFQSTQGVHFIFGNAEIKRVMGKGENGAQPLAKEQMDEVQKLISAFLDRPTFREKQSFLERLSKDRYELLLRAYFQLVDKTILAQGPLRH